MTVTIIQGDVREKLAELPADHFDCIVTSLPYWGLRDYGVSGQIGLEPTLAVYIDTMVDVCRELWRVLKPSGTFWLNIGDSYAGSWGAQSRGSETATSTLQGSSMLSARQIRAHPKQMQGAGSMKKTPGLKSKDLCMVPARVALALQADGWWIRKEIIWAKPNPMPESVTDRPTSSHEKVYFLTKAERYFYDADAVREMDGGKPSGNGFVRSERLTYAGRGSQKQWEPGGGRNLRDVWTIAMQPFHEAHFATFPPKLAERCIKAGCPEGGAVLDPFGGAGTTGMVADRLGRDCTLIELNPTYIEIARRRIEGEVPLFTKVVAGDAGAAEEMVVAG